MSSTLPSDEVADDYKSSLEDLVSNDRYQISTLTLIAKENIEHAEAISRVLQNHISRVPPSRKLPALYVLDSIVKNVGTPYTVYFGRNLHTIFIHAYSQVDTVVRRKLEEMLKTWREPVPGSLSTTPVFPFDKTQSIVEALNRFRANSTPSQARVVPSPAQRANTLQPFRDTPPLPQVPQHFAPQELSSQQVYQYNGVPNYQQAQAQYQYHHQQTPTHTLPPHQLQSIQLSNPMSQYQGSQFQQSALPEYQQPSGARPPAHGPVDMTKLHEDIDDLTTDAKIECATHPMDHAAQKKLASLQSLREILDTGSVSEKDLLDIRNSILQQRAKKLAPHRPTPPIAYTIPQHTPQPAAGNPTFLNSSSLAELLKATSNRTEPSPIAYHMQNLAGSQVAPIPSVSHVLPHTSPAELPLLAQLRASGLLSATSTPPQAMTPTIAPVPALHTPNSFGLEVKFNSASVKVPRPQMITTFLNTRPNQCTTCGRRFTSDDTGREKKARHLDWHFNTKARMIEAETRGQNRSWYIDEREWIASKEYEDDAGPLEIGGVVTNGLTPLVATKKNVEDYVRVPTNPALQNAPCPIDQENFKSEWSEELQDFIWKDAIQVGGRYYHASCYKEATRDRDKDIGAGGVTPLGAGLGRISTPDSILGKRKAEENASGTKSRFKTELT